MSHHRNISRLLVLILFVLSVALVASCNRSRRDEASPASGQDEPTVSATETESLADGRTAGKPAGDSDAVPLRLTEQGRERTVVQRVDPADPRDTAFEADRLLAMPIYPMDTVLGRLTTVAVGSARDRAVAEAARSLLQSLVNGDLPTDALDANLGPGGRRVFEDLVWAASRFDRVRVGTVSELGEGEVSVAFRLLGAEAYAMGELILEKEGDRWYTSDIQVEVSDEDATPFEPGKAQAHGFL